MFKTQISRIILVGVIAFFALHAFIIWAISSQGRGVLNGTEVVYGWEAAGSLATTFVIGYAALAILGGLCWLASIWVRKGK